MSAPATPTQRRILQSLHANDGLIAAKPQGTDRPVFPHRDQRKRPVIWIEQANFTWLRGQGMIAPVTRGFVLSHETWKRLDQGKSVEVEGFVPHSVAGPANTNCRPGALERLARRRGPERGRWLSAAELEAGRALARDWQAAGHGAIQGQNFDSPGVQGGDRNGAQERAMLARITASTRLRTAREILGEDLAPGVIALCCHSESLENIERMERWAAGSGKQIVKLGLARLVRLYGTVPGV